MNIFLNSISDLLINLAAGWFGAAFILPMTIRKFKANIKILLINLSCGIITLLLAVLIRSNL